MHAPDSGWLDAGKKRDVAALFTCGDTIWTAATEEQNVADRDEPPFRSVVYPVATLDRTIRFDPPASRPITLLDRPPARWVSSNKIEGLSGDGVCIIKLPNATRKKIKLDAMLVLMPREEGGRKVFPVRPKAKR